MSYGWAGSSLEIDLSLGKIERKQNVPELYETYLGGKGIGARLLWERVPPEIGAFSPDNLLIINTGVLTGTPAPTANRGCISFRSPQTNLLSYSMLGGFWPAELKHAGYDTVIISGKSPTPVYLWINNGNVEMRDATHLWRKDTKETHRIILEELKNDRVQTVCIGQAGENKVYVATVEHRNGLNSAARTGPGAVMGDKNLKAIAVYGTKDVSIAKPAEFMGLCDAILKRSEGLRRVFETEDWCRNHSQPQADTGWFGNADDMPAGLGFKHYDQINIDYLKEYPVRETACYNCAVPCKKAQISLPDGVYSYPMCMSFSFSFACKIPDMAFALKCYDLCARYGLDMVSTPRIIAFAIDLYQKGILTEEDTDGIHLEYGNEELAITLIEKIANREGIGDILANGTHEVARAVGRGAEEYAHIVKKQDMMPDYARLDLRNALTLAVSDKDIHSSSGSLLPYLWGENQENYLKRDRWLFPKEFEKYLDVDYSVDYEGLAEITCYAESKKALADLAGVCWWWAGFLPYTVIEMDAIIGLISCATGMDIDEAEAVKIASRTKTLHQSNNVRFGIRRKDDTVPEKLFREEPTPRQKQMGLMKLDHDKFDKQLDKYYELRGWNSEGIPTRETLDELGLGYVRQDLENRGILGK